MMQTTQISDIKIPGIRLIELIGEGASGIVCRAENLERGGEIVAVKILRNQNLDLTRFNEEAQILLRIDHPNVVKLIKYSQTPLPYIVMEFIESNVRKQIDIWKTQLNRNMPIEGVVNLCRQAAMGLHAASEASVIHRDIKPDNLLVTSENTVKVADFGHARNLNRGTLTPAGAPMGDLWYMSPEEADGVRADTRSDIYSLGVTLYEMLTGNKPYKASDEAAVFRCLIKGHALIRISEYRRGVPDELQRIVTKCLERDPQRRFQTPGELANALRALQRRMDADERVRAEQRRREDEFWNARIEQRNLEDERWKAEQNRLAEQRKREDERWNAEQNRRIEQRKREDERWNAEDLVRQEREDSWLAEDREREAQEARWNTEKRDREAQEAIWREDDRGREKQIENWYKERERWRADNPERWLQDREEWRQERERMDRERERWDREIEDRRQERDGVDGDIEYRRQELERLKEEVNKLDRKHKKRLKASRIYIAGVALHRNAAIAIVLIAFAVLVISSGILNPG